MYSSVVLAGYVYCTRNASRFVEMLCGKKIQVLISYEQVVLYNECMIPRGRKEGIATTTTEQIIFSIHFFCFCSLLFDLNLWPW